MMEANLATTPSVKSPSPPLAEPAVRKIPGGVEELTRLAKERLAKGLAPPPEVYQLPYRSQIDWSRFPEWAWPTDPEVFEGCCHEG
jgi:hypothetical protein